MNNILLRKDKYYEKTSISCFAACRFSFSSTASADVSVSGSQQLVYSAADSITILKTFGSVDFGLSTTTASGMTISYLLVWW